MSRHTLWVLVVSLIASPVALPAGAAVWTVDQGGGGDFLTIQEAIAAAASGDEIIVYPGNYVENLDYLGKDLWVHSSGGPATTTIDGGWTASCVVFASGETLAAVLEGFTLTRGAGTYYDGFTRGGAVFCRQARCTLLNCIVIDNEAHNGGGLQVMEDAGAEVEGCSFQDNVCHRYGGSISASNGFLNLISCEFVSNHCTYAVGGVSYAQSCTGVIEDCLFRDNTSPWVGALNLGQPTSTVTVTRCVFDGNESASGEGGAVRVWGGDLVLEDCLLVDNQCPGGVGGGLAGYDGATTQVNGCTFFGNGAGEGGNLFFGSGDYVVSHTIVAQAASGGGLSGWAAVSCCDAWGNAGGNYLGMPDPTGMLGNISADPRFCDPPSDDFTLAADSPCAEENNPECGQIGRFGIGCTGPTPVESVTWGGIKAMFR